jgi:hypothetical protein
MFRTIQVKIIFFVGMVLITVVSMSFTVGSASFSKPVFERIGEPVKKRDSTGSEKTQNSLFYDASGVFEINWYNDQTFAYTQSKKTYTDSTIIELRNVFHNFTYPVKNRINSPFGYRGNHFHKGLDIHLERGDTVLAAFDGIVRYSKFNTGGYGNLVIIRHHNGLETYYAHLTKLGVKPNDTIYAGQFIGTGGNTGAKHTGPHLHFEVRIEDNPINPSLIFDTETFTMKVHELELSKDVFSPTGARNHKQHASTAITPAHNNTKYYYVLKGDNLGRISSKYGTTVRGLCKLNRLTERSVLQIGQKIRVQ